MATTFLEPGGDADFGFGLWANTVGPPTIVTDIVHGGHVKSIKFAPNAGQKVVTANGTIADAGTRLSFYLYINALPTNGETTIIQFQNAAGSTGFMLELTSGGTLVFTDASFSQLGSSGGTLSTGQWYRISIAYTITSTTVNTIKLFINGIISTTVTNGTLTLASTSRLIIGNNDTDATLDMRGSDFYIDNSNALTDPGNIWVTAKRSNANGTTIGFTTQIGSGGSGYGTGHSPQVNERPNSDTNGWSMVGAGSAVTEEYNIEGQSIGDINISGSTIIDYMGWVRSKALVSETASIIVNGVSSNIALTSTTAFFTKIAGSSTYPAGTGTDIGEITSTTLTTVSLYECGVIVAYIPSTGVNASLLSGTISQPILSDSAIMV